MFDLDKLSFMMSLKRDIYRRGVELFKAGRVKNAKVAAKNDDTVIEARVVDDNSYVTSITLGRGNEYKKSSCSCVDNYYYGNICPHIGALYEYINNDKSLIGKLKFMAADEVLDEYFLKRETSKKQAKLAYTFEYFPMYGGGVLGNLYLKIGVDRLYVVKNIKNLLDAIEENKIIDFGKKFSFNPRLYEFKGEDKKIIDFFMDLYSSERTLKGEGYYIHGSFFSGKSIRLNERMFVKFSKLLGKRRFDLRLSYDQLISNVTLDFQNYPFLIDVDTRGENIAVDIKYNEDSQLLNDDGSIVYSNNKLYILDTEKSFYYFVKVANKRNLDLIEFKGESKNKLLSIIPEMIDEDAVRISGEIKKNYISEKFEGNLFLDKYKSGISLRLEFKYGENKINPMKNEKINPFIIRKYGDENKIMTLIEEAGFKVNGENVYLDDNDKMFIFFRDIVSELSKLCSIYYTDDVKLMYHGRIKKVKSYVSTSISTGIVDINVEIDGVDKKELKDLLISIREKKNYHRLKNGNFVSLEGDAAKDIYSLIEQVDKEDIRENVIELNKYRAISLLQRIKNKLLIENTDEIDNIVKKIRNFTNETITVPEILQGVLRDYQVIGFKWLMVLVSTGLGGILADDMGLGKTVQAIALICSESIREIPSLVVAPSSLLYNWESEVRNFAPDLKVLVIEGNKKSREEMLSRISEYDLIITSYPLIRRDIDMYKKINFNICILDEAQHIKNPESQNAHCAKKIMANARFVLTGTPIENSLVELWSLFDFIMPGYFVGKNKFIEKYQKPILKEDKKALDELKRCISPFILRRTKKEVLKELPEKIETKLVCELTHEQKTLYAAYLEDVREKIQKNIREKGFDKSRIEILSALTRLRQICCHPSVFVENYNGTSGKMELLEELIDELIGGNHRILLFSQFTSLLGIIKDRLEEKNISFLYLDGSTPVFERIDLVDKFNSGWGSVFLISLKAGGTGLNLTSADTVIHFDPWWNPAVEEQATDRVYRIGQENRVQVFKLITKNTIEERIFMLQNKKKELIDSVIQEGETFINKLSREEILSLFSME